jgi:hypothetical protein
MPLSVANSVVSRYLSIAACAVMANTTSITDSPRDSTRQAALVS